MKQEKCNRDGCNKTLDNKRIKTSVGDFCSTKCQIKVAKKIFLILVNYN